VDRTGSEGESTVAGPFRDACPPQPIPSARIQPDEHTGQITIKGGEFVR